MADAFPKTALEGEALRLEIPVYVEQRDAFRVQLLFDPNGPRVWHARLQRALMLMARELRGHLGRLGRDARHDKLARLACCPATAEHRLDLNIPLRRRTLRGRFVFVVFRALGRRVAFTPSLPEVWFTLGKGEILEDRAEAVLAHHLRQRERQGLEVGERLDDLPAPGRAFTTRIAVDIRPPGLIEDESDQPFALFGGSEEPVDGAAELERVGRCLDELYPDDLERAVHREPELRELARSLEGDDPRPVLVLGERLTGKTAIVHEHVRRALEKRGAKAGDKRKVWLISPQRLISGMSYVGQWESRLLAILDEVKKRQHLMVLDDVLGLFDAGVSASSDLCVAHVLRPLLERREVRVLAEMTPAAFRILQERDRAFADLFHKVEVRGAEDRQNARILIAVLQDLEARYACRFEPMALPGAIDLLRRFARHLAFPGKAAAFLRRLAVKHGDQAITLDMVHDEHAEESGLPRAFLSRTTRLERREIVEGLGRDVLGQPGAVGAVADVVATACARVNDPDRPLGSLLFLGPTGVGKTWLAQTLARYLYGRSIRLLRFDMNEFTDPGSAARLVGTFGQPDGLLTGAVRRCPFSVVLLDEIEKAEPMVHDLLLQVLGEGRLSNARGRTVDFSNAIVILTSNLGVREAASRIGFQDRESEGADALAAEVFRDAAERFFRPELFNRLDRIVPFARLGRDQVAALAHRLIKRVLDREGLIRRRAVLAIEEAALDQVAREGYDAELGARALRRVVERRIARPVAARLAALEADRPAVVEVALRAGEAEVRVSAFAPTGLRAGAACLDLPPFDALDRAEQTLDRLDDQLRPRAGTGAVRAVGLGPAEYHVFYLRERVDRLRERAAALARLAGRGEGRSVPRRWTPSRLAAFQDRSGREALFFAACATGDLRAFFKERAAPGGDPDEDLRARLRDLVAELAWIDLLAGLPTAALTERATLSIDPIGPGRGRVAGLAGRLSAVLTGALSLEVDILPERSPGGAQLACSGPGVAAVAGLLAGIHLFRSAAGALEPVSVRVAVGAADLSPGGLIDGAVVRLVEPDGDGPELALDLGTGLLIEGGSHGVRDECAALLAGLPLPPELRRFRKQALREG